MSNFSPIAILPHRSYAEELSKVVQADPNWGRCLLTLQQTHAVQACHLLRADESCDYLFKLEYRWGLEAQSLSHCDYRNMISLRADVRMMFEKGLWALIPSKEMVEKLFNHATEAQNGQVRPVTELYSTDVFEYTVIPWNEMMQMPIYRRQVPPEMMQRDDSFVPQERCVHPFKDMGTLRSHVWPHFAVWDLGYKLRRNKWQPDISVGRSRCLDIVSFTFASWISDTGVGPLPNSEDCDIRDDDEPLPKKQRTRPSS